MIQFILLAIVLLALATLYIGLKKRPDIIFDKICNAYLLFVLLHALYAIIAGLVSADMVFTVAAPFILGYGVFFFLGLNSLSRKISKKDIYIHFAPFTVFLVFYTILLFDSGLRDGYLITFYIAEYSLVAIGLIGYAFWAMLSNFQYQHSGLRKQFIITSSISIGLIFVLVAIVLFAGFVSIDALKGQVTGTIIYSGMLMSVIFAFVFRVNNTVERMHSAEGGFNMASSGIAVSDKETETVLPAPAEKRTKTAKAAEVTVKKYNKSALSPAVLDDYMHKLEKFIVEEKVYLDNELTLENLAKKMRMPMHHLTQLFNVYLGENFNQHINRYRIEYACELLLENNSGFSIEQIAFNSGFNSKVSFNRHFKNVTGYTPKEYSYKYRSTGD